MGLMGALADAVLNDGGSVHGIITEHLVRLNQIHPMLTSFSVTTTMQHRKSLMFEMGDAFIALPGGIGTFEEIFEVITLTQLGVINKPSGFLNVRNYYTPLRKALENSVTEGFMKPEHYRNIIWESDVERLLLELYEWRPIDMDKWIL